MLTVHDLAASYPLANQPPHTVFAKINLAIETGQSLSLLGPSGCGKSTLLRVVAGLTPLASGEVKVPEGAKVRMVFQEPYLLPWLNVAENVQLGLRLRANENQSSRWAFLRSRQTRQTAQQITTETLERLGIGHLAEADPRTLSGGQASRVALARAMVTQPDILLLDEPFAALDPHVRHDLQRWLRELQQQLGLTMVFVTHDVDEALLVSDLVAVMRRDQTGLVGPYPVSNTNKAELLAAYQSPSANPLVTINHYESVWKETS